MSVFYYYDHLQAFALIHPFSTIKMPYTNMFEALLLNPGYEINERGGIKNISSSLIGDTGQISFHMMSQLSLRESLRLTIILSNPKTFP